MLIVTSKGQTEALTHHTGYALLEEVNGSLELSLTSFSVDDNPGHSLIEEEAVIESLDGRDFRIKQIKSAGKRKSFTAISTFFDLVGERKYDIYGGTHTFNEFATWLFAGTGWTFENKDVSGSKLIPNYGNENFLKLLEVLLSTFECEREIMPGNHIVFQRMIGPDNDEQYRYGHNIKALSHNVDTTKLRTSIKGFGGDGLEVTYTSPNASIFPHAGEAEPVSDERFTVPESLIERLKQDLVDTPEVSIELDALELTQKALGERIWLIYEPLGIEFQTRIMAKTTRIPKEKSSAVIGNAMPKTLTDSLIEQKIEIDENKKQTRSRFEQTNEKIELAVERLDGAIVETKAAITVTADEIRSEVSAINTSLTGEIATANSVISQLAGQVSLKADATTVNGQINSVMVNLNALSGEISSIVSFTDVDGSEIISKVNQTADAFKIEAKNILLSGITEVSNLLNIGTPGTFGQKSIAFSNNTSIYTKAETVGLHIQAEGDINFETTASVDFSDVGSINWGTHAPNTVARFG